jgi:hypothetical protein
MRKLVFSLIMSGALALGNAPARGQNRKLPDLTTRPRLGIRNWCIFNVSSA